MSSEDDTEDFELSERDLQDAMGNRKYKKRTKHSQIYGIWADEDEDDNGGRPAFGGRGGGAKSKKDYTMPVSFVAGGVKPASQIQPKQVLPENSSDEEMDVLDPNDDEYEKSYLGQTKTEQIEDVKPEEPAKTENKSTDAKRDPISGLILGGATKAKGGYSMTTLLGKKEKRDKDFAGFAKGGFAQKLMKKMGWKEGGGLGKFDQGMINPVDVKQRVKGSGLGAHGTERTKQSLIHFPTEELKQKAEAEVMKKEAKGPQWKNIGSKPKKPKYIYKTVDDLIRSGGMGVTDSGDEEDFEVKENTSSGMKIIDMTGKEQRVITDTRQLPSQKPNKKNKHKGSDDDSSSSSSSDESEDEIDKVWCCKELEHNLDTLCKNAERDILKREREKRDNDDQKYNQQFEKKRNVQQIEQDLEEITNLKAVLEILDSEILNLSAAVHTVALLQSDYPKQWKEFQLDMDFAQNTVCPLLTAHLSRWDPLRNPAGPFRDVLRWKDLLPDYYQIILWQCWLPQVRTAIVRWEPRKPDQILEFVATWKSEVSEVIWDNLMNQLIMPKISTAVNSWDPYRETIRIDTWLLPWLPILDKGLMSQMIIQIRQQLKQCLKMWEASDDSAIAILKPWKSVWSPAEWDQFMMQNIYSKLETHLNRIIISVESVNGKIIEDIQKWANLVPTISLVKLFNEVFFTKWIAVLKTWLKSSKCNLPDVAQWYRAWYKCFCPEIKNSSTIRDRLSSALQTMNTLCNEVETRMPSEAPPYLPPPPPPPCNISDEEMDFSQEPEHQEPPRKKERSEEPRNRPNIEVLDQPPETFKDLIERRAQQRNEIFMPKRREMDGKELYILGKLTLFIEKGVCFVSDGSGDWIPTSVTKIFDKAR